MAVLAAVKLLLVLQSTQPAVVGTIRDGESGEPLAHAIVALADLDRSVVSDGSSRYSFLAVPPGPRHLTVRHVGYAPPDEGATWTTLSEAHDYWAVAFAGHKAGWLVGTQGRILKVSF